MNLPQKSWQTTTAGVVGGLALIFPQLAYLLDSDVKTVCDWNIVAAAVGMIWLGVASRDNKVTSEQVGAK